MVSSRLRSTLVVSLVLAAGLAGGARSALAQAGGGCTVAVDPCCAARPSYSDPNYTFTGNVLVGTREAENGTNAVVTIFDITTPYPGNGVNFASVQRYHGPGDSWNITNLGAVFGLTLDQFGNILVCQTSCFGFAFPGPGGNGAIYRIASGSGAINTFCVLPNSANVGLGNISYDCEHDQFFVTDHEDGKIYRIKTTTLNGATATIQESFDPLGPDNGAVGFAPLGERLWGVQWHAGRVYYSVWGQNCNEALGPPNTIRSVALDGTGAFLPSSDQLEIVMPPHLPGYSMPVSDISFSPKGSMLLAERSMSGPNSPAAHESRLTEWYCQNGFWSQNPNPYVLGVSATCCCSGIAGNGTNCAGGVDVEFGTPYSPATPFGRVWGTSDAINSSLTVYGIQGLPPGGGTPAMSAWVDFDGNLSYAEKTYLGDVEVPCPDVPTATLLSLFTAAPAGEALALRWKFGDAADVATVELQRSDESDGPWSSVAAELGAEGDVTVALDRTVRRGQVYYYRLWVTTDSGERLEFGPVRATLAEPVARFAISRLAPNPTSGPVQVEFALPREAPVKVSVLDVQGREIAVLADATYPAGRFTVGWNASGDAGASRSGIFFVRYRTPEGSFTKTVIVTP